jgi:O-acetyl-ADP-ribose deacetylase (regulator of RNase III)
MALGGPHMPGSVPGSISGDSKSQIARLRKSFVLSAEDPLPAVYFEAEQILRDAWFPRDSLIDSFSLPETINGQQRECVFCGDITRLILPNGAIVNAANNAGLGCFSPGCHCVDRAIHARAGLALRFACEEEMRKRGRLLATSECFVTPAFGLASAFVVHVVGPIVHGTLKPIHKKQLAECYINVLDLAKKHSCSSVAFPAISTGEFGFPKKEAAKIAITTAKAWRAQNADSVPLIIFVAFDDKTAALYNDLLADP